jgi:thiamine biosynthesis protein ThiS
MSDVEVQINGESRVVVSTTIAELIKELSLSGKKLAIERNREIVSREHYEITPVSSGDQLEIIHFVGGG